MATNILDPLLVNDECECPVPVPPTPSECPRAEAVPMEVFSSFQKDCDDACPEELVPPVPTVEDYMPVRTCCVADDAYDYVRVISPRHGNQLVAIEQAVGCGLVREECNACNPDCDCSVWGVKMDRYMEWYQGGNVYSFMPDGAEVPVLFRVDPEYKDMINKMNGYIILGQHNYANEWHPVDYVQNHYHMTADTPFPFSEIDLNNTSAPLGIDIGNVPTVCTDTPITLPPVVDDPGDQSDLSGAPITPLQLTADQAITTWTATPLPAGLTLDAGTGIISGTPTGSGVTTVVVTGQNADGQVSAPVTFDWTITIS